MKRIILAIMAILLGIAAAYAQFDGCAPGFCVGPGGVASQCNVLNFSLACNSQYIGVGMVL